MSEPAMTRAVLAGGPASLTLTDAASTPQTIFLLDDSRLALDRVSSVITSALYGDGDEVGTDFMVKGSGTPMLYQPTTTARALFPFSTVSGSTLSILPQIGRSIFGTTFGAVTAGQTDCTALWASPNGDTFLVANYGISKPPDINLGTNKPIFGPIEIVGIISTAAGAAGFFDPNVANAYYTTGTAGFSYLALDTTHLGRGSYTATWAGKNITSSQTQDGFQITHEYKVEARQAYGGLTCDMILVSWRVMCKFIPVGGNATMANIQSDQAMGGLVGSLQGKRLGLSAADLTITTSNPSSYEFNPSVVIKGAMMKTAGFVFGNKPLRNGEIGFVSTWGAAGPGNSTPVLMTLT